MPDSPSYSPVTVANSFIARAKRDLGSAEGMTQLKLQKLSYLFYGWCFPLIGEPRINYHVEAWKLGPVFTPLYFETRVFGSKSIQDFIPVTMASWLYEDDEVTLTVPSSDKQSHQILDFVWKRYGHLPAMTLVDVTHKVNGPWDQIYNAPENKGKKGLRIPDRLIEKHYIELYDTLVSKTNG